MLSCDTIALTSKCTVYGENMFGKNSDRPTAEAQSLRVYKAGEYKDGEILALTDLEIPQVKSTYAVVGSQPYWTWGFEMGFNEKGLIIGNEAQGSKNAYEEDTGILGLDLLRLALERAKDCREGITVITSLLEKYGQNANASALRDRRYENSYLLVDYKEVWLLETAGREWVAKKIDDKIGISNSYTIEENYDMCSENLKDIAYKNRWILREENFNFAKAYTIPAVRQTLAIPRMRRLNKLLGKEDKHNVKSLSGILRDHFDGEIIENRFGNSTGNFFSICMHMREWGESETAASIICRTDKDLGIVSRYALGMPCLSAYIPVYATGYLPESLQVSGKFYSDDSLWWKIKKMALAISIDEDRFAGLAEMKFAELEKKLEDNAAVAENNAKDLIIQGNDKEAFLILNEVMDNAVKEVDSLSDFLYGEIINEVKKLGGIYGIQKDNIIKYCEYAKINLV